MKTNNFKMSLREVIPSSINSNFHNSNETNLLSKLGLFPLPENVQASISNDEKYLNLKLKDSPTEKHLLFQFPLEDHDLSALNARPDYQELINRYHLYINDYVDEIKKYATLERMYLQKKFPGLIFNIKVRLKSYHSYINKLNENILTGKDPYINDIMAERIIISEYNGYQDEKLLTDMCDKVAKALYDFRIQTDFRMKKDIDCQEAISEKEYITKDYIKYPKDNGYQSIHILMENKYNKDFKYETQIRTLEMEAISKTSGEIAHNKYKPRLLNDLSPNRVPIYSEISSFTDDFGNPEIVNISLENRFYHFYNSEKTDHSHLKGKSNPITYKKFRKEQYEIEKLLGVQFSQIRKNLKKLNIKEEKEKQEAR